MAWVHLSNLFDNDKNFYGAIDFLKEKTVELELTEECKPYLIEGAEEEINTFLEKSWKMEELFDIEKINIPEWFLGNDGVFYNFGACVKDKDTGKLRSLYIYKIDASEYFNLKFLKKLFSDKNELKKYSNEVEYKVYRNMHKHICKKYSNFLEKEK